MFPFTLRLVPELQHYFADFVVNSSLNAYEVLTPADVDPRLYLPDRGFIRLLFDDNWHDTTALNTYTHLYRVVPRIEIPQVVMMRFGVCNPLVAQYFVTDYDSTCLLNLFILRPQDLELLNKLKEYRDTGFADISQINYNLLTSTLAKLIYVYLDLKVNESIQYFNSEIPLSAPDDLLCNCYELYVADNVFQYISSRGN